MAARQHRTLQNQYFIRASSRKVFRAISEPEQLARWLCDRAQVEPRREGRYVLEWLGGPKHEGRITDFVKGRRVAFAWSWEGIATPGPTTFRLTVKPKGKGSVLTVEHLGLPAGAKWVELYAGAVWGWTYFAMNLKSVLETGTDLRSPMDG